LDSVDYLVVAVVVVTYIYVGLVTFVYVWLDLVTHGYTQFPRLHTFYTFGYHSLRYTVTRGYVYGCTRRFTVTLRWLLVGCCLGKFKRLLVPGPTQVTLPHGYSSGWLRLYTHWVGLFGYLHLQLLLPHTLPVGWLFTTVTLFIWLLLLHVVVYCYTLGCCLVG